MAKGKLAHEVIGFLLLFILLEPLFPVTLQEGCVQITGTAVF